MSEELARVFCAERLKAIEGELAGLSNAISILADRHTKLKAERDTLTKILAGNPPEVATKGTSDRPDQYIYPLECPSCGNKGARNGGEHEGKHVMKCTECGNEFLVSDSQLEILNLPRPYRPKAPHHKTPTPSSEWDKGATERVMKFIDRALKEKPEGILLVRIQAEARASSGVVHYAVKKLLKEGRYERYQDLKEDRKCIGIRIKQDGDA